MNAWKGIRDDEMRSSAGGRTSRSARAAESCRAQPNAEQNELEQRKWENG